MWCIIPAAGKGKRMDGPKAKQYMLLNNGQTILDTTIERVLLSGVITKVMIPISDDDMDWKNSKYYNNKKVSNCLGGKTRAESVFNGLKAIESHIEGNELVMVHDAARCCVHPDDIVKLSIIIDISESIGGLLGTPIIDTVKKSNSLETVDSTIDRNNLWLAQTPQVFIYDVLMESIKTSINRRYTCTDEASAVELSGYAPRIIQGSSKNIKVTVPEDIQLANLFLEI
jgi:2-C-methyl-D-erythritol 4-phosphate cytidylyltransferase